MKKGITGKIVTSYIMIILISSLIVGLLFAIFTRIYLEGIARDSLAKDLDAIVRSVKGDINSEKFSLDSGARQTLRERVKKGVVNIESNFAIVSKDLKVLFLYPQNDESDKFKAQAVTKMEKKFSDVRTNSKFKIDETEYLAVIIPGKGEYIPALKGWIVLYTPVGPVDKLVSGIIFVLLVSLAFTIIVALIFGIIFARSVAKPIIRLKNRAELLARRDFDTRVEVNTGDELEELAHTIDKMAVDLKEYDIAQKKFLQNASHELKTPLMSIQGYAEGLKDGVFEDKEQALDVIVEESKRLKSIVEELILLSKLETMEDFYKFNIESMNNIIEKSVEKVNSIALKSNIKINLMLYKDLEMRIDSDKFIQSLINILGNCLRYARGEINITTANDGRKYDIIINDDGEGFEEHELKSVFQRFYKGKKGNTGLGMAITKVIIEKHNGAVSVANGINGGAEFRISIPLK